MTATDVRVLLLAIPLVLVAGLLVGAETAIGRVSRTRVEELRRDGVRGAARLAAVVDDKATIPFFDREIPPGAKVK